MKGIVKALDDLKEMARRQEALAGLMVSIVMSTVNLFATGDVELATVTEVDLEKMKVIGAGDPTPKRLSGMGLRSPSRTG